MKDSESPDHWGNPQRILVVLAHPDDPEFFCGATIARWAAAGHEVVYCLLTCGDKGTQDRELTPGALCAQRQEEQRAAAALLGVHRVRFLDGRISHLQETRPRKSANPSRGFEQISVIVDTNLFKDY